MTQAKSGDTVRVHYVGKLNDDTQFDASTDGNPLQFTLGEGQIIPGFEEAVLGMSLGESKIETIPAEKAYGPHREDMVLVVNKDEIPADINPVLGQRLTARQPDDRTIDVVVTEVTDSSVRLDANHPLAGQDLIFEIQLIEII